MIKTLQLFIFCFLFQIVSAQTGTPLSKKSSSDYISSDSLLAPQNSFAVKSIAVTDTSKRINSIDKKSEDNILSNSVIQNNKPIEPILIDFSQLPPNVQVLMEANKAAGKQLLDNIEKGYKIEIKAIQKINDLKNILTIVSSVNGYRNCEFISEGFIHLIVDPIVDTDNFETAFINAGINCNFLNEFYLVKK